MDKNRIRKFVVSAKCELLQKVTENADKIGITDNRISENIAYTWFIYLICIRYMDVNGVLPFQTGSVPKVFLQLLPDFEFWLKADHILCLSQQWLKYFL